MRMVASSVGCIFTLLALIAGSIALHACRGQPAGRSSMSAAADADTEADPADDGADSAGQAGDNANGDPATPPQGETLQDTPNAEYLNSLPRAVVRAGGQEFVAWIADEVATRTQGLMHVTDAELADLADGRRRGMLFVFEEDSTGGFWMKDTIIPLDIAYIDEDGEVVTTYTMEALDESIYRPRRAYRFALELRAGVLTDLGVEPGDAITLPPQYALP